MTRTDRRTLVRQLAEEGLSQRQIAARLGISKDTVRRDLRQDVRQPEQDSAAGPALDEPQDAPQGAPACEPGDATAPGPDAPPETVAHEVAHDGARLLLKLDQLPALAADLAVLARTGWSPVEVLGRAVGAVADAYRLALREGRIDEGVPFFLPPLELRPAPWLRRAA